MPPEIKRMADEILTKPVSVAVTPTATTVELTEQRVYAVEKGAKPALLQHLLTDPAVTRALVFTRTKHGANKVVKQLGQARIVAEPIHSNKSQAAREKALSNFKSGRTRVLVATDIAARGIDVDNITHVINFDLPNEPETYVHRIGRTGRAGATGIALSFCSSEERAFLRDIEKLIRQRIDVVRDHPFVSGSGIAAPAAESSPAPRHTPRYRPEGQSGRQGDNNRRRRRRGGGSGGPSGDRPQPSQPGSSSSRQRDQSRPASQSSSQGNAQGGSNGGSRGVSQGASQHGTPHTAPQSASRSTPVRRPRLTR
jgi:ATP-dependent RNA helicase RhlE